MLFKGISRGGGGQKECNNHIAGGYHIIQTHRYRESYSENRERTLQRSMGGRGEPQLLQVALAVIFSNGYNEAVPVRTRQRSLDTPKPTKTERQLRKILMGKYSLTEGSCSSTFLLITAMLSTT